MTQECIVRHEFIHVIDFLFTAVSAAHLPPTRDRRYQDFGSDTDTDTLAASESIPGLIPGPRRAPN